MGPNDIPDHLSDSERAQYFRYCRDKLAKGQTPRTPEGWKATVLQWRTQQHIGKIAEKGLEVVLGLEGQGFQPQQHVPTQSGQRVIPDFRQPRTLSRDGKVHNLEVKAAGPRTARDAAQFRNYLRLMQAGERLTYYVRQDKAHEMSQEMRALIDSAHKQFPDRFQYKEVPEKVWQRLTEAGANEAVWEHRKSNAAGEPLSTVVTAAWAANAEPGGVTPSTPRTGTVPMPCPRLTGRGPGSASPSHRHHRGGRPDVLIRTRPVLTANRRDRR